jgi:molybdate transport system ATP-binding protein
MAGEIAVDFTHRFANGTDIRASLARTLAPGAILVLFGPSGAGKTTILRAVAGLLRPDRGRIESAGVVWFDSTANLSMSPQARRIGYVAQDTALFPHLTSRNNVEYGLRGLSASVRRHNADAAIRLVGVGGLEHRLPRHLSGGEAQRVALARALAPSPALLLLDEPFGALDGTTRRALRGDLRAALRATGTSAILVTHDRLEALAMGDDLAVMVDGEVRQTGAVAELFRRPADPAVARALGVETVVPAIVEDGSDGLVGLRIGTARLVAIGPPGCRPGASVFACMRAEDVLVQRADGGLAHGSVRNHLRGVVVEIEPEGAIDRVTIDCGFRLMAAITHQSREELGLAAGSVVEAAIKATAIHVVPML